ncbi:MAG: thiamine pyrophosphate-dependent enzyme [Patescibacteria group bacterium]|nr:thiamine pyrophosphate-dependent enzyme [Patescibacteria group bacterium]
MPAKKINLNTKAKNTWCPGCGNFTILAAFKKAVQELIDEGIKKENFVITSGIGCSSKIIDYINLNSFSALHGRPITSAEGIKMGNPNLKVVAFQGDGGCYNEGISHLIHAAKRNIDITVLIHNNRNFALTTGQFTATSPQGFVGKSTPEGSIEKPFNPLKLMLDSGATFIARGYSGKINHLKNLIKQAVKHQGFSFIDILQPCVSFFDTREFYNKKVSLVKNNKLSVKKQAQSLIEKWDYQKDNGQAKIPVGLFYKLKKSTYEKDLLKDLNPSKRDKIPQIKI